MKITQPARPPAKVWAAYAAAGWSWAFAAMSFYWAAGGTLGLRTLGNVIQELALARDPLFLWLGGWGVGVMKVVGGVLALMFVPSSNPRLPRWLLITIGWGAGVGMILYGAASFVQHALMLTRTIDLPNGLGEEGARGHLLIWDPWWTLGGILYVAAVWIFQREGAKKRK
jgi:hypothetical protein